MVLVVGLEADARDRDHHRVAAADLGERTGPWNGPPLDADDELVGSEARSLRPDEELAERDPARPGAGRCGHDGGVVGGEHRNAVARRRRRCEVPADRRAVADLPRKPPSGRRRRGAETPSALPRSGRTSCRRRGRRHRRRAATSAAPRHARGRGARWAERARRSRRPSGRCRRRPTVASGCESRSSRASSSERGARMPVTRPPSRTPRSSPGRRRRAGTARGRCSPRRRTPAPSPGTRRRCPTR